MQTPPSFAEYPRPQKLPSGIFPRPPGVHYEALNDAWSLFAKDWTTWVPAQLLVGVIAVVALVPFLFVRNFFVFGSFDLLPNMMHPNRLGYLYAWVADLLPGLIVGGLQAGLVSMAIRQVRGQPIAIGNAFGAFRHAPKMLLLGAIVSFPTAVFDVIFGSTGGLALSLLLMLVTYPLLALAPFVAIDQDVAGRVAAVSSVTALRGFRGALSMLLLLVVIGLLYFAGALVCGVGLLAAAPVGLLTLAVHYSYFFPDRFPSAQPVPVAPPANL